VSAARAIEWRRALAARVCDDVRAWEHGTVVRASAFPTYYHYNLVRVEGPDPGLEAAALAEVADEELAGLEHRRVEIEDLAAGDRVRSGFEAMGWVAERLAFLHRELPAPEREPPAGTTLDVAPFEASRPLRLAWRGESLWDDPPDFVRVEEAAAALVGSRSVVGSAGGEPAGFSAFAAHGDTMEVELVFCLPERRNRGLGGALVSRALAAGAAAGARHALIEADDDGDAKRLYERLGFRTIWVRHSFTRRPANS
jgi:ribosomal protein S18 acetylase RimI-like enzyme